MTIDLVIFDCDGVLVDSEPISNRVLAELLTEQGLPTTPRESMDTYMGRTMTACLGMTIYLGEIPIRRLASLEAIS